LNFVESVHTSQQVYEQVIIISVYMHSLGTRILHSIDQTLSGFPWYEVLVRGAGS